MIVKGKRQQNPYRSFGQCPVNNEISEILANLATLNAKKRDLSTTQVQNRAQSEK